MNDTHLNIILNNFGICQYKPKDLKRLIGILKGYKKTNIKFSSFKRGCLEIIYYRNDPKSSIDHKPEEKYFTNKFRLTTIQLLRNGMKDQDQDQKGKENGPSLLKKLNETEKMIELQSMTSEILMYDLLHRLKQNLHKELKKAKYYDLDFLFDQKSTQISFLDFYEDRMSSELREISRAYKVLTSELLSRGSLFRDIVDVYKIRETPLLENIKYNEGEYGLKNLGDLIRDYVFEKSEESVDYAPFPHNLVVNLERLFCFLMKKRGDSEQNEILFPWSDLIKSIIESMLLKSEEEFFSWDLKGLRKKFFNFKNIKFNRLWISEFLLRFYPKLEVGHLIKVYADLIKAAEKSEKSEFLLKCVWLYLNYMIDLVLNWSSNMNVGPSKLYLKLDSTLKDKQSKYVKEAESLQNYKNEVFKCVDYCYGLLREYRNFLPSVRIGDLIDDLKDEMKNNFFGDEERQSHYVEKYHQYQTMLDNSNVSRQTFMGKKY